MKLENKCSSKKKVLVKSRFGKFIVFMEQVKCAVNLYWVTVHSIKYKHLLNVEHLILLY